MDNVFQAVMAPTDEAYSEGRIDAEQYAAKAIDTGLTLFGTGAPSVFTGTITNVFEHDNTDEGVL